MHFFKMKWLFFKIKFWCFLYFFFFVKFDRSKKEKDIKILYLEIKFSRYLISSAQFSVRVLYIFFLLFNASLNFTIKNFIKIIWSLNFLDNSFSKFPPIYSMYPLMFFKKHFSIRHSFRNINIYKLKWITQYIEIA